MISLGILRISCDFLGGNSGDFLGIPRLLWHFFGNSEVVPLFFFGNSDVFLGIPGLFRCFSSEIPVFFWEFRGSGGFFGNSGVFLGILVVFWEFRGCSGGFLGIPGLFQCFFGEF